MNAPFGTGPVARAQRSAPHALADRDDLDLPFPHAFWSRTRTGPAGTFAWVDGHLFELRAALLASGAVLLRGFDFSEPGTFEEVARRIAGPLGEGYEGPSPRKGVGRGVFSASEVSSAVVIPAHAEMSYLPQMPRHLFFSCREPSRVGGETTIVDGRRVLAELDPVRIEPLVRGPLRIRRRHAGPSRVHDPFELNPWSAMFGTRIPDVARARARALGFEARFERDGALTLEHEQLAVRTHPLTSERAWLNHLLVFHSSAPVAILESAMRREREVRSAALFPVAAAYRNLSRRIGREVATDVRLANGDPIPDATVEHVREVVDRATVALNWRRGDFLVLDNHLVMHGRRPFRGRRDVVVSWSEARA